MSCVKCNVKQMYDFIDLMALVRTISEVPFE